MQAYHPALPWTLFHEPWWLDATAPGNWQEVVVEDGGVVVGRLPFMPRRKFGFTALGMPPLTRTLGPQVVGQDSDDPPATRRSMEIAAELFGKLPRHDYFFQICDPHLRNGLGPQVSGVSLSLRHTFRIAAGTPLDESWRLTKGATRAAIRRASSRLAIDPALDIDEFCGFYERAIVENHGAEAGACKTHTDLKRRLHAAASRLGAVQVLGARDTATQALHAATMVVWGRGTMYYLLTCRCPRAVNGAVALLVWETIRLANQLGLTYDFDSYAKLSAAPFLASFGGRVANRLVLSRSSRLLGLALALRRG